MGHALSSQDSIHLIQPTRITFGVGCSSQCIDYLKTVDARNILVLASGSCLASSPGFTEQMQSSLPDVIVRTGIPPEPSVQDLDALLEAFKGQSLDTVVGLGGGSVLDVAKLFSVLHGTPESVHGVLGNGNVKSRRLRLVCLPTTSGAGSEASPNAVIYDPASESKQAAISPCLVADVTFVDPALTLSLPPDLTASTGFDALSHCIEAYTSKLAHPIVDRYALEGIELLVNGLEKAILDGSDMEARSSLSLGSLYGGLCLGPVNTAGVHALSYPLGSMFRLSHGLSNALLLPAVMEFNIPANPGKYARIARLMGASEKKNDTATAFAGIKSLKELMKRCGLPAGLRSLDIQSGQIPKLADAAMKVERLLRNNPRTIQRNDAVNIYQQSY